MRLPSRIGPKDRQWAGPLDLYGNAHITAAMIVIVVVLVTFLPKSIIDTVCIVCCILTCTVSPVQGLLAVESEDSIHRLSVLRRVQLVS